MQRLRLLSSLACFAWFFTSICAVAEPPKLVAEVLQQKAAHLASSVPWERYQAPLNDLPIGVFDSGIGGLTVLEEILKLDSHNNQSGAPGPDGIPDFANEKFIYFGDQANMPYGNYSSVNQTDFLRQLILRDTLFLIGDQYWASTEVTLTHPEKNKLPVKAIVIACNTATAYGLEDIRSALNIWQIPIPVIGVVEAGGKGVLDIIRQDPLKSATAVLATVGTCDSQAYPKTIARLAGEQGLRLPFVWQQGSVGMAGAIEGSPAFVQATTNASSSTNPPSTYQGPSTSHTRAPLRPELAAVYGFDPGGVVGTPEQPETWRLTSVENYIRYDVASLVDSYRLQGGKLPIQTVVLGCTHFPLAETSIRQAFERLRNYQSADGSHPYRDLIAPQIDFVNPGQNTAKELFRTLTLQKLRHSKSESKTTANPNAKPIDSGFFVSVPYASAPNVRVGVDGGFDYEYKYGRDLDTYRAEDFRIVPFHQAPKLSPLIHIWHDKLPHVAALLDASQRSE